MLQNSSSFDGGVNLGASTSAAAPPRLESCFTCFRKTDSYVRIVETAGLNNYNPAAIFAQHFWFTKDEYYNRTICSNCWIAIDDFHHFYCQVEKHHPIAIKSETLEDESSEDSKFDFDHLSDLNQNIFENGSGAECGTTAEQSRFKCDEYPESFTEESHHHCVVCDQYFDTMRELRNHQRNDHVPTVTMVPDVVTTNCIANKTEQNNTGPNDTVPNDPIEFKCEFCPKVFSTLRELKQYHSWRHKKPNERKEEDVQPSLIETRSYQRTRDRNLVSTNTDLGTRRDEYLNKATTTVETDQTSNVRNEPKKRGRPPSTKPVEEKVLQPKKRKATDKEIAQQEKVILKYTDFKCSKCSYVAETFIDLRKHGVKKHKFAPTSVPAQCCGRRYFTRLQLYQHCLTHINPTLTSIVRPDSEQSGTPATQIDTAEQEKVIRKVTDFKCTHCRYAAETFIDLKKHGVKKHNFSAKSSVAAQCCGKRYYTTITLYYHCLTHIDPNRFKCNTCGTAFGNIEQLRHHKLQANRTSNVRTDPKKSGTLANSTPLSRHQTSSQCEKAQQEKLILKFTDFKCSNCPYKAKTFLDLRRHGMKKHNFESANVTAQCCGKRYPTRLSLYYHCLTHKDPNRYKCNMCGTLFDDVKLLRYHKLNAKRSSVGTDPKKRGSQAIENLLKRKQASSQCEIAQQEKLILKFTDFKCSKCSYVAETFLDLKWHGVKKHNIPLTSVSAQCCGKGYNSRIALYYHCLTHIDPNRFKCKVCGKVFKDIGRFRNHNHRTSNVRTGSKKNGKAGKEKRATKSDIAKQEELILKFTDFRCSRCPYIAKTFVDLKKHGVKKHKFVPTCVPAQCCGRRYVTRTLLYQHCLTHVDPNCFKCNMCGKAFKDVKLFRYHNQDAETLNQPVKCYYCDESFVQLCVLKQHVETHHGRLYRGHNATHIRAQASEPVQI